MSKTLTEVNTAADYWETLITRVNQIISSLNTEIVTANTAAAGGLTVGNCFVSGIFGTVTLAANTLRGGTVSTSTPLNLESNLVVNANYSFVHGNVIANSTVVKIGNTVANTTAIVVGTSTVNVALTGTGVQFSNTALANATVLKYGNDSIYASVNSTAVRVANSSLFALLEASKLTVGNSTTNAVFTPASGSQATIDELSPASTPYNDVDLFELGQGAAPTPKYKADLLDLYKYVVNKSDVAYNNMYGPGISFINGRLDVSVASNNLTVALKTLSGDNPSAANPVTIIGRNSTLTNGNYVIGKVTQATVTIINNGSTMGATSGVPFELLLVGVFDTTFQLGLVNQDLSSGLKYIPDEYVLKNTTGGNGGNSAGVIYSQSAASNKVIINLAILRWTNGLNPAGQWNVGPTYVQHMTPSMEWARLNEEINNRINGDSATTFDSGTKMLFMQTAAPTGWTKVTTSSYNDCALRIVTGTASSGGSVAFSTAFGRTSTDATTLSSSQIPSHTHSISDPMHYHGHSDPGHYHGVSAYTYYSYEIGGSGVSVAAGPNYNVAQSLGYSSTVVASDYSSGAGISISYASTGISGTGSAGSGGSHTHSIDMRVKYVDVIIASKD